MRHVLTLEEMQRGRAAAKRQKIRPPGVTVEPIVRQLVDEQIRQDMPDTVLARRVGLGPTTLYRWRSKCTPRIADFRAAANVLGFEVMMIPFDKIEAVRALIGRGADDGK